MKETEVLENLSNNLDSRGYILFVDSGYPDSVVSNLVDELDNCRLNRTMTIGRRIPDIIGFTNREEIFAVEVKGEKDIRKGIGQAAHYRQGVHKSYLAAEKSALSEFYETAQSCGLGIFSVSESGTVSKDEPVTNIGATEVDRTRRALSVKTSRLQSDQNSFPSTTRPENALIPVITVATDVNGGSGYVMSEEKCRSQIEEDEEVFNQSRTAISLATTLQLVKKGHTESGETTIGLTDVGLSAFYLMSGLVESRERSDLYEFVEDLKNKRYLYKNSPELASYLRDRYLSVPDVRLLVDVLASYDGSRAELSRILAETALASPDAFLNLFCGQGEEEEFRKLMDGSRQNPRDKEFRKEIIGLTSPNSLYNFLYQIRHVEILTEGTKPVHQDDVIEIGSHHWKWDPEIVGEVGAKFH